MIRRSAFAILAMVLAVPVLARRGSRLAHATAPTAGGRIAFSSDVHGKVEVYTANADGTRVSQVTDSPDARGPSWSPDGQSLWYAGGPNPTGIYVSDARGRNL